jgi:glutathione S-transferase
MTTSLILYDYKLDDGCYRVRLALSMLGLKWQPVAVDVFPGKEHLTPRYLAMNPMGRLPILQDGDLVLHGTEAILAHLARAYDSSARLMPRDGAGFAQVMQWLAFSARDLDVTVKARQQSLFDSEGDQEQLRQASFKVIRIMDDHMTARNVSGADWFAAEYPTIADIALFPAFALSRDFAVDHDEFPALRRWVRRFRALPGFQTMPGIPDYH